ncbi:MAG: hypothetical protein ACI4T6_10565 [Candidatus Flemingiibacterium sp.]
MIIIDDIKKSARRFSLPPLTVGLAWCLLAFMTAYLLKCPQRASRSAADALTVCAKRLVPSLFPFIVVNSLICKSGLSSAAAILIGRPFERLTGLPGAGAAAFLLGLAGGFPVGAVTARELYDRGELTADEAARLIAFSNNAGLAFCVGGIGSALYDSLLVGWKLWCFQLIPAILIALITADRKRKPAAPAYRRIDYPRRGGLMKLLADSVAGSALTMLKICAFAVFFAVIGDILTGFFTGAAGALAASLCELTLASRVCAELGETGLPICAFAVGFAGMSVHAQVAAVLSDSGIPMRRYFLSKLAQGLTAALLTALFC